MWGDGEMNISSAAQRPGVSRPPPTRSPTVKINAQLRQDRRSAAHLGDLFEPGDRLSAPVEFKPRSGDLGRAGLQLVEVDVDEVGVAGGDGARLVGREIVAGRLA